MTPYTILVEFILHEGALEQFLPLLEANAATSLRVEPGCKRFDVLLPAQEHDRVLLYEIYEDITAFRLHADAPHFQEFARKSEGLVRDKKITELSLRDLATADDVKAPPVTPTLGTERCVSADRLRDLAADIFARAGTPDTEARLVANTLVEADLRGMQSHGVLRVPIYTEKISAGGFKPGHVGTILRQTSGTVLVDGEHGLGQVVTMHAMELAMQKAGATGIGAAGVLNSNHFGEAAYYVLEAAKRGMIAIVATNGSPNMPALGGMTKMTGPLPFTAAVPTNGEPFCIDAALGMTNRGKLIYLAQSGASIPLGWGVDKEGRATEDPKRVLEGGWILPIGAHKGFGITMFIEILSGVLTGASVGSHIRDLYNAPRDVPQGLGHFCIAIDPAAFMPLERFKSRMDEMISMVKASKLAPGVARMVIPGEPETESKARRLREGIPLSESLLTELNALARSVGSTLTV